MPVRCVPPSSEKVDALANSLVTGDIGQVAVAADLLARLTEDEECARIVCSHSKGEALVAKCLELAAKADTANDVRADVLVVLKNTLAIPEGQHITCGHASLRAILEAPPTSNENQSGLKAKDSSVTTGKDCDMSAIVRQAWLGLASSAVTSTSGGVLEGPRDLGYLQDAVFELCDQRKDIQTCIDGLLLLQHLYERKSLTSLATMSMEEATKLAALMHWGLDEAFGNASLLTPSIDLTATSLSHVVVLHVLHLLSLVGYMSTFRRAWFKVDDEEVESEQLDPEQISGVNRIVHCLFSAIQSRASTDPVAWKAIAAVADVKFVRRLMRVHPDIAAMFTCLLDRLDTNDLTLAEQAVFFLKQIFTGATDQFLSTEHVMFDNLGQSEGITRLLSSLIKSWVENPKTSHRGNIVALLADAMFFSSFTDSWQTHAQANDLIGILFDALLWKGVEGTAGLALGNFVSANGHINLILDHDRASYSISNVGWFLKRTSPGWDTKMQIYYLWRVLRSRKGCELLRQHPHASLVISGLLKGVRHATMEDNEVLGLLEYFLRDTDTRVFVLAGANTSTLLVGVCELLSGQDADLHEPACVLLLALIEATGPGALLSWHRAPKLISSLSQTPSGREVVDLVVPLLQWEPALTSSLSLEYKRKWISRQIRAGQTGEPVIIPVSRGQLLLGLCERLCFTDSLRRGVEVKFEGDGENGVGDGHRREFFRLAAAELMDASLGLFKSNDGQRSFHPSSTAFDAQPEALQYFELCGKLVSLALMHQETLPALRFTLALRKLILEVGPLEVEDISGVDPDFFKHKVLYILESKYAAGDTPLNISELELVFEDAPQPDVFPNLRHELFPGGSSAAVTEENKLHYVELLCDHRMRGVVSEQVNALINGIRSIIPDDVWAEFQRLVSPEELDLLICGLEEVDTADWRANSVCSDGVDEEAKDMFWNVVESMSLQERKELLEFVTGSPGPPVGGFAALPGYGAIGSVQRFTLSPARNFQTSLPVASTCFNTLYLPKYDDTSLMRSALLEAVANRNAGGFYEGAVSQ